LMNDSRRQVFSFNGDPPHVNGIGMPMPIYFRQSHALQRKVGGKVKKKQETQWCAGSSPIHANTRLSLLTIPGSSSGIHSPSVSISTLNWWSIEGH
jgi:hypothetical protein